MNYLASLLLLMTLGVSQASAFELDCWAEDNHRINITDTQIAVYFTDDQYNMDEEPTYKFEGEVSCDVMEGRASIFECIGRNDDKSVMVDGSIMLTVYSTYHLVRFDDPEFYESAGWLERSELLVEDTLEECSYTEAAPEE